METNAFPKAVCVSREFENESAVEDLSVLASFVPVRVWRRNGEISKPVFLQQGYGEETGRFVNQFCSSTGMEKLDKVLQAFHNQLSDS